MHTQTKNNFLFYTLTLLVCLNAFFLTDTIAQDTTEPLEAPANVNYTFETIEVPGVDFLAITASSDFEDYAGYTKSADGEKEVAFTLIDGVFMTYDFPGSVKTHFYALGNNGNAAGHYEDSEGLFHGVILENGELRQYDFPNAVETEIYGISDATGALTGNFTDAAGIRRGFSDDLIIEFPDATATYADFVNASGIFVGSYVDSKGVYNAYQRFTDGQFTALSLPSTTELEYFFIHGINDQPLLVARAKAIGDVPRTYVGPARELLEIKVPGSVSTEGWNINQDSSIVGYYDTEDGRRHSFIARFVGADQPAETSPDSGLSLRTVFTFASEEANTIFGYTYQTIDVPGVDTLELAASSDFEDYAGNTRSPDGQKTIGFTLIDGVYKTYDFPGSKNTYFYALGNNGIAAGYYEDSNGMSHGVILENSELRQYDFPGSVETEIYGYSDATGAFTGNYIDSAGVRYGFTGETSIEHPHATATFADFVTSRGVVAGSYIDAEGIYHAYGLFPDGSVLNVDYPEAANLEFLYYHGINDRGSGVVRAKSKDDITRTYVGRVVLFEFRFPGSVSTDGYNINQDGSVVGHYKSADGRTHGFIAKPVDKAVSTHFSNAYSVTLSKGLNMLSVPLAPPTPMTAKDLVAIAGATTIVKLDAVNQKFVAWTPGAPNDGFAIEGDQGYIVNVPESRNFAFVGSRWTNPTEETAATAPALTPLIRGDRGVAQETWAFVVSGHLEGKATFDDYQVVVRNLRTNSVITASVEGDYFAAATADLARRSVVEVGDVIELRVLGPNGNAELQPVTYKVTPQHLSNAVLSVRLDGIGHPTQDLLLQNYPNPFNPETWIPYQLSEDSPVSISIYDTTGKLVRTLSLGFQSAGFYNSRERAAYWDGRNALGERVASGVYFYTLTTGDFTATRRMLILK